MYNTFLRLSKKSYYEFKLQENQKDPKSTWKFMNESMYRLPYKSSFIQEVKVNGQVITDSLEIANKIRNNIPDSLVEPKSYLQDFSHDGVELKWFENYLKDRKQFVMINGVLSEFFTLINILVLQGSILEPLLFLCFFNGILPIAWLTFTFPMIYY